MVWGLEPPLVDGKREALVLVPYLDQFGSSFFGTSFKVNLDLRAPETKESSFRL